MRLLASGIVLSFVCLSASCATVAVKKNLVVERAAFDLGCQEAIEVVDLGNQHVFGATGCGRQATYVVRCSTNEATSCAAILNSEERADGTASNRTPAKNEQTSPSADPNGDFSESSEPEGAGGIEFGQSAESVGAACQERGYKWKRVGDVAVCSSVLQPVGYDALVRIKLCSDAACELRLGLDLAESSDSSAYFAEFAKLHASLERLYGTPAKKTTRLSGRCSNELLACLKDGTAALHSAWRWKSGVALELDVLEQDGQIKTYLNYTSRRQETPGF